MKNTNLYFDQLIENIATIRDINQDNAAITETRLCDLESRINQLEEKNLLLASNLENMAIMLRNPVII